MFDFTVVQTRALARAFFLRVWEVTLYRSALGATAFTVAIDYRRCVVEPRVHSPVTCELLIPTLWFHVQPLLYTVAVVGGLNHNLSLVRGCVRFQRFTMATDRRLGVLLLCRLFRSVRIELDKRLGRIIPCHRSEKCGSAVVGGRTTVLPSSEPALRERAHGRVQARRFSDAYEVPP